MRLHIGELALEQLLGALDRQRLDLVRRPTALVIAAAGIAFRILIREHRSLRFEPRPADDIFRRDQLDLRLLAGQFGADRVFDRRVHFRKPAGEETMRHAIILMGFKIGGSSHQSLSCNSCESSSTRRWWRPPAKSVARKAATQALAMSLPTSLAPSARTLASLCSRASVAEIGSSTRAQRQCGSRFTAIEMPIPEPQTAIPRSAAPVATARASFRPNSG